MVSDGPPNQPGDIMSRFQLKQKLLSIKSKSLRRAKSSRRAYSAVSQSEPTHLSTNRANFDTSPRWIARTQQRLFYQNALYPPVGPTSIHAPRTATMERPAVAYPEYLARRLRRREGLDEGLEDDDHKTARVLVAEIERESWDEEDDLIEITSFV